MDEKVHPFSSFLLFRGAPLTEKYRCYSLPMPEKATRSEMGENWLRGELAVA